MSAPRIYIQRRLPQAVEGAHSITGNASSLPGLLVAKPLERRALKAGIPGPIFVLRLGLRRIRDFPLSVHVRGDVPQLRQLLLRLPHLLVQQRERAERHAEGRPEEDLLLLRQGPPVRPDGRHLGEDL
eukprot:CAMPEP_0182884210 /NCGR_PEP_ID=MMETSP0034_2-20130328/18854_1 /TAXON_ID=156128 /ORGANISM="Nephroselmis pyriformis, Strain CCMP717" /LENGTH=127 /DNA_ID=CAMNT_0025017389 /DNA_START=69 /DNA_END=452 /DNA_ORIENTATION=+